MSKLHNAFLQLPPLDRNHLAKVGKEPDVLYKQGQCDTCGIAIFGREQRRRTRCGDCENGQPFACFACGEIRESCSSRSPDCAVKKQRCKFPRLRDQEVA